MKISKAYFNRFKKEFLRWQQKLGLTQYGIAFFQEKLDHYAEIIINEKGKNADVFLTTELKGRSLQHDQGPESHAKHEAIHLLLHRLVWLGASRYIETSDMEEEWEAVVVRLEKVLI
jgi:hypothetical protein